MLSPPVLALNAVALILCLLMLMAAGFGLRVLLRWDAASGNELQLRLERRTYLISTLVAWCIAASALSLLLFVYTAEQLSSQIVGAMCATGVLNSHALGWPTLLLKIGLFFAGVLWLLINKLDNEAPDYPLVRLKYLLLLLLTPLVFADAFAQLGFFLGLDPDLITSCCGALFSTDEQGVAAELSGLPPGLSLLALYVLGLGVIATGLWQLRSGRGAGLFAVLGALLFPLAIAAIISSVALYVYEHPHHHCPFCLLKAGHDYIGYLLYLPLFAATAMAMGAGVSVRVAHAPSLAQAAAMQVRQLTGWALGLYLAFFALVSWAVLNSNLKLLA